MKDYENERKKKKWEKSYATGEIQTHNLTKFVLYGSTSTTDQGFGPPLTSPPSRMFKSRFLKKVGHLSLLQ